MPELAEVKTFVNQLNKEFNGLDLFSIEIVGGKFLKEGIDNLLNISLPLHAASFNNKGKFIYWTFNEDVVFFNSLGMTGSFGKKNKHSAIKFSFSNNKEIYYNDIRRFGNFSIHSNKELKNKLKKIGWDPFLEPSIPISFIKEVRRKNNKTIAETLMDQSIFGGCGNYIKNEILYACKIHPNRTVLSLSDDEILNLAKEFKNIANEALNVGGATLSTYSDMYGIAGSFFKQFKVYSKKYDPEGNIISKIKTADGRTSFFVEKYQKI